MTLNITTVAAWLMSQTSDFRTTHRDSKNKSVVVESHTAQKQFVLLYPTWSGLLCYTGVAAARGTGFATPHDTAEWLEKLLEHPYERPQSPRDIANLIMSEGDTWLPKVPEKDRRTTFTMIAYERAIPRLWMISNFERPGQPPQPVGDDKLFLSTFRVRKPKCIVTGWTPAVSADQQKSLLDLIAFKPDPDKLADAVAIINRDAAPTSKESPSDEAGVSEECVVATLSPDGAGQILVYGDLPNEFIPRVVISGRNLDLSALQQQHGTGGRQLDSISWPDRAQTLVVGIHTAPCIRIRDPWGFKWPDDPTAGPPRKVPVEITMGPADDAPPGTKPVTVTWMHRENG
ncbi:hypothetical protein ACWDTP_01275 [Mycobacterium sp. NPDC003449]